MKMRIKNGALLKVEAPEEDIDIEIRSKLLADVHEAASDLDLSGEVDPVTMHTFDVLCLTPISSMTPEKIRALRTREGASQIVFAAYLNVTPGLVSKWERGEKRPRGASLKLLSLVARKGLEIVA